MKVKFFLLGLLIAAHSSAQPFTVKITADNYYAVYTGTEANATTKHLDGAWPTTKAPGAFTPSVGSGFLYIVAWDDGRHFEGLLATVQVGGGFVPTGSPLWTVCATNNTLALDVTAAPTPTSLTPAIAACNAGNSWHATSNGLNNENASSAGLWGKVTQIEGVANWIWDTNGSAACKGTNTFLDGRCNPGEYLIFRVSLANVKNCLPPIADFVINWTAGYGTLVANGTNSEKEQSHFWSIEESDQSWGRKTPEISQWFTDQQAGVFDLKAFFEGKGQHLKCDTYYRVKLAVSNKCVNWVDTSRLVKLKCCPGEIISPPQPRPRGRG